MDLPLDEPVSVEGNKPEVPLTLDVIARVLQLFCGAWQRMTATKRVLPNNDERIITGELYRALVAEKAAVFGLQTWPRIEDQSATRSTLDASKPEGIIDFKLIWSWDEREYFGVECKRVAASESSLASKYVREGVMRFVTGKYAPDQGWGAMLAMVVDGNLSGGIDSIAKRICNGDKSTRLEGGWQPERRFGFHKDLFSTAHQQLGRDVLITVMHLFLEINASTPMPV